MLSLPEDLVHSEITVNTATLSLFGRPWEIYLNGAGHLVIEEFNVRSHVLGLMVIDYEDDR